MNDLLESKVALSIDTQRLADAAKAALAEPPAADWENLPHGSVLYATMKSLYEKHVLAFVDELVKDSRPQR